MFKRFRIKKGVFVVAGLLMFFALIGFVEKKQDERVCKKISINIDNRFQNYFVDQQDIFNMINGARGNSYIGEKLSAIDLKYLEKKIETNKFVKDAQVFDDLKGNLIIEISQMRPLARIIHPFGGGAYISTESTILPLSSKFSSRVMVVSGPYCKKLTDSFLQKEEAGKELIDMINYIQKDEFLRSQVAQMDIDSNGEMILYPQIGKQIIEFGNADNYESKFRKLKAFYKEILPVKGWGTYEKISLKYENQIVCE